MPRIADFDGLDVEALDQLGIDGFDASSEPLRPVGGDKGLSRLGGLQRLRGVRWMWCCLSSSCRSNAKKAESPSTCVGVCRPANSESRHAVMAIGGQQRRVDNQAIVSDAQPALAVDFVFGRTIAQGRCQPADGLGAENPALKSALSGMADGHRERIYDLAGSLITAQSLNDMMMHPSFDLPEVGALASEGDSVA